MSSELKTNKISPATGTALQIGDSGDTITIASGATLSGADMGLASVQTFTSSGTWTKPAGITKVIIEVQGGGAGGCQNASSVENITSGPAGGYAKKFLDVSSISTATITVGAAGTGGSGNPGAGTVGGNSSWADGTNTISGNAATSAPTGSTAYVVIAGGTATGGDINIPGTMAGPTYYGWAGPHSMLGFGGGFVGGSSQYAEGENDAVGYGAGGGGSNDFRGGHGAPGIVIVWEYK